MKKKKSSIVYQTGIVPDVGDIIRLYVASGINRPVEDMERLEHMYRHSNLIISAWEAHKLVGIARSLTDFSYCCYLSDLAVDAAYQRRGIGRELIARTREAIGTQSMLLLLSAPKAMEYYPKVGFDRVENGFIIPRSA